MINNLFYSPRIIVPYVLLWKRKHKMHRMVTRIAPRRYLKLRYFILQQVVRIVTHNNNLLTLYVKLRFMCVCVGPKF